jgi:hypothetical protein
MQFLKRFLTQGTSFIKILLDLLRAVIKHATNSSPHPAPYQRDEYDKTNRNPD